MIKGLLNVLIPCTCEKFYMMKVLKMNKRSRSQNHQNK